MVIQPVPLQPMEIKSGADIHLVICGRPHTKASACVLKEAVTLGETMTRGEKPTLDQVSGRTCRSMGDPHGSKLFLKDCSLRKETTLKQFLENCSSWEGPTSEKFMEVCLPWVGLHTGEGEASEEEEAAETTCVELTTTSISNTSALLWGRSKKSQE